MRRRRAVVAVLLGLLPVVAACSTVPLETATVQITQVPQRPAQEVGIEPVSPEPGATQEEIVRGFIDAAASTLAGHPIAREYLTEQAAETWNDEGTISIISQDYSASVTTDEGAVRVTAELVGTVDQRGIFDVNGTSQLPSEYTLEEVDGEWRIANPPDGLVMIELDFERLYDRLLAYFIDPTGTRVVPDPRYLITGDAQPTALLNRVLEGPSAALSAGVRSPLSGGEVQLRSAVTVNGSSAVVDLTGLDSDPEAVLAGISAQVVWTLRQLGIQTVQIRVDGEVVQFDDIPAQQTIDDWVSFDPDSVPVNSVAHYIQNGGVRLVSTGDPVPGPAGDGRHRFTSAAAKIDPRTGELNFLAGVGPLGSGQQLLAGPYGGGPLARVLDGVTLTAPTVAATRAEIWVVRNGREVFLVQSGGPPRQVDASTLPAGTEVLQLSPDGVRAAVVADSVLSVGTVVRDEEGNVALRDLRPIAPTLAQVVDVAWRDSEEMMVLAGGAGDDRTSPYLLGVDGWGLDDVPVSGLPEDPTSIAAAPTRAPLVVAQGAIWQLVGGNTWVTIEPGSEPRRGSEPFYPL